MADILGLVLKLFFRLSQSVESETEFFSLPFYQKLIYDNWIFDMAKLIDIAAVYHSSNSETVKQLITTVFENQKKFVEDFKETVDQILGLMKWQFKEYVKIHQELNTRESISTYTAEEMNNNVLSFLGENIEILGTLATLTKSFPDSILLVVRSTSCMLYLANYYCLMGFFAREIKDKLGIHLPIVKKETQEE